jgi:DNA-binding NarL/FixJ family response regulator
MPPVIRVGVVDDHRRWRREIVALLRDCDGVQIVGEADDGSDAISLARTTTPDLLLLDVELPTINGIEAARRILAERPAAHVLFMSAHRSPEVVETALLTGARGYLLKPYVSQELPVAIQLVASGSRFVSAAIGGRPLTRDGCARAPHVHSAVFFARFVADALCDGRAVIGCLSSSERSQALRARIAALAPGLDLDLLIDSGRYTCVSVADLLAGLLVDGRIDDSRFYDQAIPMLLRAAQAASSADGTRGISGFGDTTRELWRAGQIEAAIRLEQLWDEMSRTFNLDLLCGYPLVADDARTAAFDALCAAHSATVTR